MWNEIVALFSGFGYIPMIFLFIGLVLCLVEIFVPGFGIFGILGSVFVIGGTITRMMIGANVYQFIIMVTFSLIVIIIAFIVMVQSAKHGLLSHSPLVANSIAVSKKYGEVSKEYKELVGKIVKAKTNFSPIGTFEHNGVTYEAICKDDYVNAGSTLRVIEVNATTIYVQRCYDKEAK